MVQHVQVSDGGKAVIAGKIEIGGCPSDEREGSESGGTPHDKRRGWLKCGNLPGDSSKANAVGPEPGAEPHVSVPRCPMASVGFTVGLVQA